MTSLGILFFESKISRSPSTPEFNDNSLNTVPIAENWPRGYRNIFISYIKSGLVSGLNISLSICIIIGLMTLYARLKG